MTDTVAVQEQLEESFGIVNPYRPPQRLPDETRRLAARALAGEFGRQMVAADFALSEEEAAGLSPDMRYARTVQLIAERAPLRLVEGERVVGSATLREAAAHGTPALPDVGSTSHTTIDLAKVLRIGYRGVRQETDDRLARGDLDEPGTDFVEAMRLCLDAAGIWHTRYVEALREEIAIVGPAAQARYREMLSVMESVPEEPPRTFHEAVQALWAAWSFQRLCGNWSGIGRIDEMLGPYLERDLKEGTIDLDEARDILAHFWIKGCEWITGEVRPGGDAQFYQNILLSGVDAEGRDVTNEATYLVLDVAEELHISDFPIAVRVNSRTPDRLWRRIAEVQRLGGGIVSIYNEEVVIPGLTQFGYPLHEARTFANDGCWEVLIPGKTHFRYGPFDTLQILQRVCGLTQEGDSPGFEDFEDLYQGFLQELRNELTWTEDEFRERAIAPRPAPLLSLLVEGCLEKGRGYHDLGPKYTVFAPHAGGLPDTVNSLHVMKRLVFEEQRLTFAELRRVLLEDWQGQETLRQEIRRRFELYGNDSPEADAMMERVFDDYTRIVWANREIAGILRPAGISTFGREANWRDARAATPFGSKRGDVLATNLAATPGTDKHGPTALMKSHCRVDLRRVPCGVPLELKLHPTGLRGEQGLNSLVSLLKSFVSLGGFYLQVDVIDTQVLRDAQKHPNRYPNLCVRISGWSARFTTLPEDFQEIVIRRTEHCLGA